MALSAPSSRAELLALKIEQARRLSPHNLPAHLWLHQRTSGGDRMDLPAHAQVWANVLQRRDEFPYVDFVAPPGSSKSTVISIGYTAWELGRNPALRIGVISNTDQQAQDIGRALQEQILSESYRRTYGDAVLPGRKWDLTRFYVAGSRDPQNPSVLCAGWRSSVIQGKRFDLIVLDDPTNWDEARSETTMQKQRAWLKGLLINRFPLGSRPPHGDGKTRMVVVQTRWSENDLFPVFRDELKFKVVHMPALGYWDRLVTCEECGARQVGRPPCEHPESAWTVEFGSAALWPEMESREALRQRREADEIFFELVDQGNPAVLLGDYFDPAWFRRGELPDQFEMIVMGVDTAGGRKKKKGDYAAIVTLGVRSGGQEVWVIDAWRDRVPATKQEDQIKRRYAFLADAGYRPDLVVVENANEGGSVYDHLSVETRIPLELVTPEAEKAFRAIPLANAYKAGRVWHPVTVLDSGEQQARWVRPFEAELEAFPEGAHDDMMDAAVYAFMKTSGTGPRLRSVG